MTQRAILLEALASTPADVARLVRGLDEAAADWSAGGRRSCRAVVAALVAAEPLFRARLQRVVDEERPSLAPLVPPATVPGEDGPIAALADRFRNARAETLAWLQALGPGAWQRPARDALGSRATLRSLVQDLVAHDIDCTGQLAEIRASRRAALAQDGSRP